MIDQVDVKQSQGRKRLGQRGLAWAPTELVDVAVEAFRALGHRPEELVRALRPLRHLPPGTNPDLKDFRLQAGALSRESAKKRAWSWTRL
jgi:hypothetical protein